MVKAVNICMMCRRALVAKVVFHSSFHNWENDLGFWKYSHHRGDNRLFSYFETKSSESGCKVQSVLSAKVQNRLLQLLKNMA